MVQEAAQVQRWGRCGHRASLRPLRIAGANAGDVLQLRYRLHVQRGAFRGQLQGRSERAQERGIASVERHLEHGAQEAGRVGGRSEGVQRGYVLGIES